MKAISSVVILEKETILAMRTISPKRLREGGAPMLQAEKRNHHIVIKGNKVISPLVDVILRVRVVSYVIFARANIHDEHKPWAIIKVRAPVQPHRELDIIPPVTRPIWATEEYAIRDLMSV